MFINVQNVFWRGQIRKIDGFSLESEKFCDRALISSIIKLIRLAFARTEVLLIPRSLGGILVGLWPLTWYYRWASALGIRVLCPFFISFKRWPRIKAGIDRDWVQMRIYSNARTAADVLFDHPPRWSLSLFPLSAEGQKRKKKEWMSSLANPKTSFAGLSCPSN